MNNIKIVVKNVDKAKTNIKKGVILLIRGGGVKSASAIGTIKALEDNNIPIVAVSGTSIGAIPAALLACGYKSDEILNIFIEYNNKLRKSSELMGGRGSVEIEINMYKLIGNMSFSSTRIPCYINATDGTLIHGEPFVFCNEVTPNYPLAKACRASASFPFFYKPFKTIINGNEFSFIDGGVTENTFIPDDKKHIIICTSFRSEREKRILNKKRLHHWEKTPYVAEKYADISLIPELENMNTTGSENDILKAYYLGYETTNSIIEKLLKEEIYVYKNNIDRRK